LVYNKWIQAKNKEIKKIYFGWWTVLATAIVSAWAYGTWGYGFGAYFKPLQNEFGWSRAQISAAYSLNKLEGGLEGPWGGILTDKYGPRMISVFGNFIAGLGLCLMYFLSNLWQYIIIWGFIVSMGFNLGTIDPLEKALSDWFVKKRGRAIGLGRVGLALGGTFGPPVMTFLLLQYGWRTSFLVAGVLTWVICIPISFFLVKPHRPEYYDLLPDGDKGGNEKVNYVVAGQEYAESFGEIEFTLRQALKTRAFWILVGYNLLYSFFWASIGIHQIPHLTDMGIDPVSAATVLGFMVLMSAPGRLVGGYFCDKLNINKIKYILIFGYSLQAVGMFILIKASDLWMVYLFTILTGFGGGIGWTSRALLRGRYFGRKAFATIYGTIAMIALPATIISPIYVGWVYDISQSYINAFTQSLILLVIVLISFIFLNPPRPPEKSTDVNQFI
jgi:MFS family permease